MALGDPYATAADLKSYLKIDVGDTVDDAELTSALAAVSRGIEAYCHRQFNRVDSASPRRFNARSGCVAVVDDIHTATDLAVATDPAGTGVFSEVWTSADYELEPLNGIVNGEAGWPWWRLRAVRRDWPTGTGRAAVQVTAQWGWTAAPAPVKQACLVLAAETFKLKDAPFGVAGFGEYGAVRVRKNPVACQMLDPYRRDPVLVG